MQNTNKTQEKKIYRVANYLRLSDEDRDKTNKYEESESIKNQRNMLMEFIQKNPNYVLVDEYCDEDLSGAGTFRPEFERLINDCEHGKIDIVLCKSQSRFSRDMEIIERYLNNKFIEWNVRFISLSDNADTNNIGNKKARQINGLVNEWYLEDVSNNIRAAFSTKMKQGEYISPFAPFGYEISPQNNNKLIVDEMASEVVKKIFHLYLQGYGFTGIANYLNNEHIPSPSLYKYQKGIKLNVNSNKNRLEIKWSLNAIKTILTNEIYLGHLIQGKRTTVSYKNHKLITKDKSSWIRSENTHESIIDLNTFKTVQAEIKKRTKSKNKAGLIHPFSGKVYCLECNHYLKKKNSSKHEYLVCSKTQAGYLECDNNKSIRYDKLEELIINAINKKIKTYYDENELEKLMTNNKKEELSRKIDYLQKQKTKTENIKKKAETYLKNLYEDKTDKKITLGQFQILSQEYCKLITNYNNELNILNQILSPLSTNQEKAYDNKYLFQKYKKIDKLNRIIINEFIDKIMVGKVDKALNKREIEIIWNLK